MFTLILIVHIIVSVLLILVILMQQSKGGMSAMFGGSQDSVFGASGADTFFTKATAVMAVIFMITSFSLALLSGGPKTAQPATEIQPQADVLPEQTLPQTDTTPAPLQGQ
ncbi:MAG: preprotein translocase subunit SecG [bacterium]|nr:preprotein translocase subunit SecG [bacterium]